LLSEANEELNQTNEELKTTIDLVNTQKELIQTINKNTDASIRYAQRIQSAILPPPELFSNIFKDHFILFKPRNIVAGDFYFLVEIRDKIFVAVADCTGHGVPGAFMSMIGNRLLYEAIIGLEMDKAGDILDFLNVSVIKTLRQEETKTSDGMDIGLVIIDKKTHTFQFAGAHHSLLLFNPITQEPIIVDGTVSGIGGVNLKRLNKSFQAQEMKLFDQETMFYLYTDGFADQVGGATKRKYLGKNLRLELGRIQMLPVEEQALTLEANLIDWMQDTPQTDDILILGFKY
jgi:serine phosphatase RsbU (regulator of sigma subunit)